MLFLFLLVGIGMAFGKVGWHRSRVPLPFSFAIVAAA